MKIKTCLSFASFFLLSIGLAHAQAIPDDIRKGAIQLRDSAMQDSVAWDVVESLTMEVGPRSAGSAGDAAAVQWAVKKLKSLGFENVHTDEVQVPHWDRGTLDVRVTSPFRSRLLPRRSAEARERRQKASRPRSFALRVWRHCASSAMQS